jgi:hypothetical protein
MERGLIPFRIDPDFKQLIPPLTPDEFRQLEQNLLAEGCREPLCVWNGILLDGHNRYEICTTHNIPFTVQNIQLESHDAAVAWICKNQLEDNLYSHTHEPSYRPQTYLTQKNVPLFLCRLPYKGQQLILPFSELRQF